MSLSSLRKSSKMFGFSIQSITKSFWRKPYDTSKTSLKSEHFERYEKLRDQFMIASAALSIREIDTWSIAMWLLYYPVRYLDFVMSSHHRFLDRMIARLTQHRVFFPHGFFGDGWGDVTVSERIRKIAESDEMKRVHTIKNGIQWMSVKAFPNLKVKLQEGSFRTTLEEGSVLPECSQTAYFELVTPLEMKKEKNFDTLVISLPGTGEHGYGHRRNTLAIPLALHGVSTLVLSPLWIVESKESLDFDCVDIGRSILWETKASKSNRIQITPVFFVDLGTAINLSGILGLVELVICRCWDKQPLPKPKVCYTILRNTIHIRGL